MTAPTKSRWTRPAARCGTDSGYRRHRMRKQIPCVECTTAHAAAERRRYRTRKAATMRIDTTARSQDVDWSVRYPDGHREFLYRFPGDRSVPVLPKHAKAQGAVLVFKTCDGEWVAA